MTIVYGGCCEPGGYELSDDRSYGECPKCHGPRCLYHYFEDASGGSINQHHHITCDDCGYRDVDLPDYGWDCDDEPDYGYDDEEHDDGGDPEAAGAANAEDPTPTISPFALPAKWHQTLGKKIRHIAAVALSRLPRLSP